MAQAAPAAAERHTIEYVKRDRIRRSPRNPRRIFDAKKLDELAEDIRVRGIIQSLLVRRVLLKDGQDLELVAGERRLRAADKIDLAEVPVVIVDMNDEDAFDAAMAENGKRADMHPLEEADAFALKRDHFKRSVEEIAARIGRSVPHVYQRLSLRNLCDDARKAFLDEKLSTATALLVARIPVAKLQAQAVKDITSYNGGEGMSTRAASEHIQRNFMLRLELAPFARADAQLVPAAGACTTCPKRTGNQRELFGDVQSKDICTDPHCYQAKMDAEWKRRSAAAKVAGVEVLSDKQAKEIYPYPHAHAQAGYVSLDEPCRDDTRKRTYGQLLGKKFEPTAIARDPHNDSIRELVSKAEVAKALKAKGHDFKKEREALLPPESPLAQKDREARKAEQERRRREQALKERVDALAFKEVAAAAAKRKPDRALWMLLLQFLVDLVADMLVDSEPERLCETLGIKFGDDDDPGVKLLEFAKPLNEGQLRALVVRVMIVTLPNWGDHGEKLRKEAYEYFGVDMATVKKWATVDLKADEKVAAAAASPATPGDTKKTKGKKR